MFTGIIESLGEITNIVEERSNKIFTIKSNISKELKIDQSIAHNGVCLTVIQCDEVEHQVAAIKETLELTNLHRWQVGSLVNLERCMTLQQRLDGHLVQGHVDGVLRCLYKKDEQGSWRFGFELPKDKAHLVVQKGSICINGTSLTAILAQPNVVEVAIIPYTLDHTNFNQLAQGDIVNVEYDILGKYIERYNQIK